MSLRSLGYLLTRRFYPRKICSQQAAVATALLGGLGILILKKHLDDADNNVTDKDTKEARNPEVTDNKPMQVQVQVQVTGNKHMEKRDVDMEARFHKWMKLVGRVYPNHEEETRRFEIFKGRVKRVESLHGSSSFEYYPNKFADKTDREILAGRRHSDPDSRDFDEYDEEALFRYRKELELKILKKKQELELKEETSIAAQKQ